MDNLIKETFPFFSNSGLIVLVGISGSGKSTWVREQFADSQILSSDTMRGMLTDDATNQDCSKDAFKVIGSLVELRLSYGKLSVIDATNLKRPARRTWLQLAQAHNVPAVVVYFDVPLKECIRRQETRDRQVPEEVVRRQANSLNNIDGNLKAEGWNGILKVTSSGHSESVSVEVLQDWISPQVISDGNGVSIKHPKLDIIGDVHGCYDELTELLEKMGWFKHAEEGWRHPENRFLVFVGDLTDRGPNSLGVLELVAQLLESQKALLVLGNHDHKLGRWLQGKRVQEKHGLEATTREFSEVAPQQLIELRNRYLSMIQRAPLFARWDPDDQATGQSFEHLIIAHAAWRPELNGASLDRMRSYCIYGPNTGEVVDGLPQRLDWKVDYPKHAPFCVVGHTAFDGPVVERNNTMCIDTACVFGGRLTGLKWPEKEVVQVDAKQAYEQKQLSEAPVLVDPSTAPKADSVPDQQKNDEDDELPRYQMLEVGPAERFDLNIESLFQKLFTSTEDVLGKIHNDEKLMKKTPDSGSCSHLVLANASKALFTPEQEHQLLAKGLIYTTNPWRVVSVPYLKMYNYTERSDVFDLANEMAARDDINVRFNEKLDGTMIQLFSTVGLGLKEDKVVITTRGMIDGWSHKPQGEGQLNDDNFDFLGETRRILESQSPAVLDPQTIAGWSLIWEFIHPGSRVVTNYGDRTEVVLTGAVDFRDGPPRYITRSELESLAATLGAPVTAELKLSGNTLEERIDQLSAHLEGTDREGAVVTFEGKTADGRPAVLHRVKIKGAEYLRLMRLFVNCTYNQTREYMESDPSLQTWDSFKEFLMKQQAPEEVLAAYRVHFENWSAYRLGCDTILADAKAAYAKYLASNPMPEREAASDDYRIWRGNFAQWVMTHAKPLGWLFFAAADCKLDFQFLNSQFRGCQTALQETIDQWQKSSI
ncbi:AAA family ATPase [Mariniblastus sp.]|nr:AAA family ATPase [Mariniblastus sp.]